jgi:hypothetical protein
MIVEILRFFALFAFNFLLRQPHFSDLKEASPGFIKYQIRIAKFDCI